VTDGRKRLATALTTLSIAALGGSLLNAAPSAAEPTIPEARERVESLYHEAEQASERYNDARLKLQRAQKRLDRVQGQLEAQRERVETVRDQVAASVVAYYQGDPITAASRVALSDDPDAFITQMTTVDEYTERQAAVADQLTYEIDRLERREAVAEDATESIADSKRTLAEEKAVIDEKASEAEALLERLELERDEAREQRVSRSGGRTATAPITDVAVSGSAGAAVEYALAQVGDAYVYGAAGPSAFDCSGLTMMAWGAAGVGLPHSSGAQMGSGASVSSSALRPGDLVFYYSPVSHDGIYIGNGQVAHAANPSTGVRVDPVGSMPISGAVRPG
jgi:cell wall-associated NlpC family hydrolase